MKKVLLVFTLASIILFVTFLTAIQQNKNSIAKSEPENNNEIIFAEEPNIFDETKVQWGQYEFAGIREYDFGYHLMRKNLLNQEIDYLIPVTDDRSGVSSIYLFNNSLYIVSSGHLSLSQIFYLDSPESEPVDITKEDMYPSRLEIIDNNLYLVEEFGDFCIYGAAYHRLINTNDFEFVVSSSESCAEETSVIIGFWNEWAIYTDAKFINPPPPSTTVSNNTKYVNLYLVNLYNTDQKVDLITTMPELMKGYDYSDGEIIFRSDNSEWSYNLITSAFSKLQ